MYLFAFLRFSQENCLECDNTPVSAPRNISEHRDMKVN
jgi:hypothetical protein